MQKLTGIVARKSKVAPGVVFRVRRLNNSARARAELAILPQTQRMNDLTEELRRRASLLPEDAVRDQLTKVQLLTQADSAALAMFEERTLLYRGVYIPAMIRAGVAAIEGMDLDGQPISVDQFTDYADEELLAEALGFVNTASGPEEMVQ